MSSIIILGDPHIGKSLSLGKQGLGHSLNSRVADQLDLLDWTLDQAIENTAEDIIVTGDVFEEPKPPPYLITLFISWLKKCQANSINVHLILGNHDILRSGSIYSSSLDIISEIDLDNVFVYKNTDTIFIDNTAFTFVPFRDRKSFGCASNAEAMALLKETLVYELASIPVTYPKVLVGHLAIEGSIFVGDEIDDLSNELFCPLEMFQGYDYVWMGHVHKPQVLQKSPHVAHIGSMDISNFGETDHKKQVVLFNTASNSFVTKIVPTRPLKKINIVIPKDTVDTTKYVIEELKSLGTNFDKAIVRVEIVLSVNELLSVNKSIIEKFLLEQGVFSISGISESKKPSVVKKDNINIISSKMDVASAIKKYAEAYVDDKLRTQYISLSMEIYNAYKSEVKE